MQQSNKKPYKQVTRKHKSQLRIIGGRHRGRKLSFEGAQGLRPTLDQVRETLFNWLSADIHEAKCLDLFAGSGALGFEALSRGAKFVEFVDNNSKSIANIEKNLKMLSENAYQCFHQTADQFINLTKSQYDLIFIDPPYHLGLLEKTLSNLKMLLSENTLIYIEMEAELNLQFLDSTWEIIKYKKTNRFSYALITIKKEVI